MTTTVYVVAWQPPHAPLREVEWPTQSEADLYAARLRTKVWMPVVVYARPEASP